MAKAAFKRRSAEEKKQQVEDLLDQLEKGVLEFQYSPEKFKAILEMKSLMPNYSIRNMILAKIQKPSAQFIAPFKRWKELNRNVIKGETALRILAPRFKNETDEVTGETQQKLIGYLGVPVFDVSQTEGEELPIDRIRLTLDGESEEAVQIFEWVQQLAEEDNCPVKIESAGAANGFYSPIGHYIVVDPKLSINHRAKTAVHELVHSRVHRNCRKSTVTERESVAEGVAFIVCSYFGLDTSDYSFEYVRGWSKEDGKSLLLYTDMIEKTANELIKDFERVSGLQTSKQEVEKSEAEGELLSA